MPPNDANFGIGTLVAFCHTVNALGRPATLRRLNSLPLDRINPGRRRGIRPARLTDTGAMVDNQGHSLSCTGAALRATTWPANARLICSGQALSTMIVVPQMAFPLLLV